MDIEIKNTQKGFTLIELMIVVAIVGILAAVAVPAYQDYITRAKMTEVMGQIDMAKTTLGEDYMSNGQMPAAGSNLVTTLDTTIEGSSAYITTTAFAVASSNSLTNNAMTITFALDNTQFAGMTSSQNTWVVQVVGTNNGVRLNCNFTGTTVPAKYLPANCRTTSASI